MIREKVSIVFILLFTFSMFIYLIIYSNSYKTIVIENSFSISEISNEGKIDINIATHEQLCEVYGIGDVLANKILEARENCGGFNSFFDLLEIDGIGGTKVESITEKFFVSG